MFGDAKIDDLKALVAQLIRVGTVTSTDDTKKTARVQFKDRNQIVTNELRVLVKNSLKNKDHWMPDIDEQVLCMFLPIGIEQGFIVGSYYSNVTTSEVTTKEKRQVKFEDGTSVEYDRENHTLTVDVPPEGGNVVLNAHTKVTVNSPIIHLGENADLEPSVLGDKLAAWISDELKPWLDSHVHPSGTPMTGPAESGSTGPFDEGEGAQGGAVYSTKNKNQ